MTLLLKGVERDQVERGMAVAQPETILPNTNFPAELYVLRRAEGGKHMVIFSGYKPQFRLQFAELTGVVKLPEPIEMFMPGDALQVAIKLSASCALEPGMWLEMRDEGVMVGICYVLTEPPRWRLLP